MLAVGRLVGIVKTIGDKVISKLRFYNTFNYLGYERQVGDCNYSTLLCHRYFASCSANTI